MQPGYAMTTEQTEREFTSRIYQQSQQSNYSGAFGAKPAAESRDLIAKLQDGMKDLSHL